MADLILRVMVMLSSCCCKGGVVEAGDAQAPDLGLAAAMGDQLGHHGAGAGAELKAMRREAELMIKDLMTGARAEHRDAVAHMRLDAGPGAHDGGAAHHREQF